MTDELAARLTAEHRELDRLLGRLLGALEAGDPMRALDAALSFQDALTAHTDLEEASLPPRTGKKLVPHPDQTPAEARARELRVEHLQVRELAAMVARQLQERSDLVAARGLAGNLAGRWRAHTARELVG